MVGVVGVKRWLGSRGGGGLGVVEVHGGGESRRCWGSRGGGDLEVAECICIRGGGGQGVVGCRGGSDLGVMGLKG